MLPFFEENNDYIQSVFDSDENAKVLVHCFAGKSRATSFTLAYLVGKKGIELREGLEMIRAVRPIVQPNIGFFAQLKIFEKKVLGKESTNAKKVMSKNSNRKIR